MRSYLMSLGVAVVVLAASAGVVSAQPDLIIVNAAPVGPNAAAVLVRNQGNVTSPPCQVALWVFTYPFGQFLGGPYLASVPPLPPGQQVVRVVATPALVTVNAHRMLRFFVDFGNVVNEGVMENNNSFLRIVP